MTYRERKENSELRFEMARKTCPLWANAEVNIKKQGLPSHRIKNVHWKFRSDM